MVGAGRCEAAGGDRGRTDGRRDTVAPGVRGHPTRLQLMRVERGNPVRVRWCRLGVAGQPTVREAQFPGGNRTPKKRTPVAERQRESGSVCRPSNRMLLV